MKAMRAAIETMKKVSASPKASEASFVGYVHPFAMDDILAQWYPKDEIFVAQDFTPALPFIQEFENPGCTLSRSVSIGQYADFVNMSDMVHDEIMDSVLSSAATEMSYKLGLSVAAMVEATGGADATFEGSGLASIVNSQET